MVLAKRFDVLLYPIENLWEAKFVALHRAIDKGMCLCPTDLNVKTIAPQKDVGGGKSDALIAIQKAMVISQRLHQGRRFVLDGVVVSDLRTKNRGLDSALVA